MTSDNGVTYSYDARDELVSGSNGDTYTYSADGDMTGETSSAGTTADTFDAYGQQITSGSAAGTSQYTWDALDRVVTAAEPGGASIALTYEGATGEVASDSSATYSRDPSGGLVGVNASAGGRTLALNDQHDDLSGLFTASGTSLSGSTTYNPWGQVLGTSGATVQVGYQGQWTNPATAQVNMGSRFYTPATGSFSGKDTAPVSGGANAFAYGDDNPVTVTDPTGHSPSGSSGGGDITAADVAGAYARAGEAKARSEAAAAAAAGARTAAAAAEAVADAAAALARGLNAAAEKARELAAETARLAAAAFKAAAAELQQAQSWQARANDAWEQAKADGAKALSDENPANIFSGGYHPIEGAELGYDALKEAAIAGYDEVRAGVASATWLGDEIAAFTLSFNSDIDSALATMATEAAKGAADASEVADHAAAAAESTARYLAEVSAEEARTASWYEDEANSLARAYAAQVARELAAARAAAARVAREAAARVARAAKKAASVVKKAAVVVGKAVYKYSGAQSVVSCVTNPTLSSCVQAAVAVAGAVLTVATGGAGAAVDVGLDAAADAATDVATDVAVDASEDAAGEGATAAADDAGESAADDAGSCVVGGQSFAANTKVLLASGAAAAISQLHPGEKVLATNTKTGKTQLETVAAILVHHDSDLYDLKIKVGSHTAIIDTTSNHLFWVPYLDKWIDANKLSKGERLKTPDGASRSPTAARFPKNHDGWMWDLTVPGNDDHDFYVVPDGTGYTSTLGAAGILVHNVNEPCSVAQLKELARQIRENADHPAAANSRTIGVGQDSAGNLTAGSSNGFDNGQAEMADSLNIRRVASIFGQHAEENLVSDNEGTLWPLERVGTDVRDPCGPDENDCAGMLDNLGIEHS